MESEGRFILLFVLCWVREYSRYDRFILQTGHIECRLSPPHIHPCALHIMLPGQRISLLWKSSRKASSCEHTTCWIYYTDGLCLAAEIVDRVIVHKAGWSELFSRHNFFHKYRHYLQAIASTGSPDLQIKWYVITCAAPPLI